MGGEFRMLRKLSASLARHYWAFLVLILGSFIVMTTLAATPLLVEKRPVEKAFKGMELYSWRDQHGVLCFALLYGTNRLKTESEIKGSKDLIFGLEELEKRFYRLAKSEQVYWFHIQGFEYPDNTIIKKIKVSANKANIKLHVPEFIEVNGQ